MRLTNKSTCYLVKFNTLYNSAHPIGESNCTFSSSWKPMAINLAFIWFSDNFAPFSLSQPLWTPMQCAQIFSSSETWHKLQVFTALYSLPQQCLLFNGLSHKVWQEWTSSNKSHYGGEGKPEDEFWGRHKWRLVED